MSNSDSESGVCCKCGDIEPTINEFDYCDDCFDTYCHKCEIINDVDIFRVFCTDGWDPCIKCGIQRYLEIGLKPDEYEIKLLEKVALKADDELKKIITDFLLKFK